MDEIILLGENPVVLQKDVFFSKHLGGMMKIETVKVLGKCLRDQYEILAPDKRKARATITLRISCFTLCGFVTDLIVVRKDALYDFVYSVQYTL